MPYWKVHDNCSMHANVVYGYIAHACVRVCVCVSYYRCVHLRERSKAWTLWSMFKWLYMYMQGPRHTCIYVMCVCVVLFLHVYASSVQGYYIVVYVSFPRWNTCLQRDCSMCCLLKRLMHWFISCSGQAWIRAWLCRYISLSVYIYIYIYMYCTP